MCVLKGKETNEVKVLFLMIFKFFLWHMKGVSGRQKALEVPRYVLGYRSEGVTGRESHSKEL